MYLTPPLKGFPCLHSESAVISRDRFNPYRLPDLWPPQSPDLNLIDYKIRGIQQGVQSTAVQDVKDLMQRLIDAWAGVEDSVTQDVSDHRRWCLHIQPPEDIMNIHYDKK